MKKLIAQESACAELQQTPMRLLAWPKKQIPVQLLVAASAWGSKIVTGIIQLVSVRVLLVGLGSEQYAVFILLTSLAGWYTLADLGVGLSLQNYISEKRAKNESYSDYILAGYLISVAELLIEIVLLYFLSLEAAPVFLKQFTTLAPAAKARLFFTAGVALLVTGQCSLTFKIWYAEQKGYLANIIPAIASSLGLLGAWLAINSRSGDKLFLSLVAYTFPAALMGIVLMAVKAKPHLLSNWRVDREIFEILGKRAMRFLAFSLLGLLITQIDYLILSQYVKAYDIVVYSITTRLFSFAFTLYAAVLAAWHPVNCEMHVKKEYAQMKQNAKTYLAAGIAGMAAFTFALLLNRIFLAAAFSPVEKITIPGLFIIATGAYFAIRIWNDTFVTMLVSINKFRPLFVLAPFMLLLSAGLQVFLVRKLAIYGIVMGLGAAYLLTSAWFLPKVVFAIFNGEGREALNLHPDL